MTEGWTQPSERRDFVEWHLGRAPYVFWALDVDTPAVAERVASHARRLAPWLLGSYLRQPHITLDICGFPSPRPALADEFGSDLLASQLAALRVARPQAFAIELGRPASFRSAPYLSVADQQGGIDGLRRCLAVDGQHRLFGDYVPHVTIGLFAKTMPFAEVMACLDGARSSEVLTVKVDRLSLMSYAPAEIGGRLECLADYRLASGAWCWHEDAVSTQTDFLRQGLESS